MKAVVQQVGARMDYAVPRTLFNSNLLGALVTDLYFSSPMRMSSLSRYSGGIPLSHVSRDNCRGIAYRALLTQTRFRAWPHLQMAENIAGRTLEAVRTTGAGLVYGFDTAMLPSIDRLSSEGTKIVMEQCIAPRAQFIRAMLHLEGKLSDLGFDAGETGLGETLAYAAILSGLEQEEWKRVDRIYCPSPFVAKALEFEGVPNGKIRILPYGVSLENRSIVKRTQTNEVPKVVFGGSFSWRKGALEFGSMASALRGRAIFEACGKAALDPKIINKVAPNVIQRGHLSRNAFLNVLSRADIFVLPSYSEGSATVIYEAMALGVPCVVSAECGSVITHGEDGIIVPASDETKLTEAVDLLLTDIEMRHEMGAKAKLAAQNYTRESYGTRVLEALQNDFAASLKRND